jgi:hypothetical protein
MGVSVQVVRRIISIVKNGGFPMCDNTSYTSSSYIDDTDGWVVDEDYQFSCIPERPRHPHFSYLFWLQKGYKNFKLIIQRKRESELQKGIKLPRWTLRSKNSFV